MYSYLICSQKKGDSGPPHVHMACMGDPEKNARQVADTYPDRTIYVYTIHACVKTTVRTEYEVY